MNFMLATKAINLTASNSNVTHSTEEVKRLSINVHVQCINYRILWKIYSILYLFHINLDKKR